MSETDAFTCVLGSILCFIVAGPLWSMNVKPPNQLSLYVLKLNFLFSYRFKARNM